MATDVVLVLVTKSKTQCQVRTVFPIVLNEAAKVPLADGRFGISRSDTKLRCPAAGRANLRRRQALRKSLQGDLVSLDAGKSIWIAGPAAAGESPGTAEILRRDAGDVHVTKPPAESNRMCSHRQRRGVRHFPTVLLIRSQTDL